VMPQPARDVAPLPVTQNMWVADAGSELVSLAEVGEVELAHAPQLVSWLVLLTPGPAGLPLQHCVLLLGAQQCLPQWSLEQQGVLQQEELQQQVLVGTGAAQDTVLGAAAPLWLPYHPWHHPCTGWVTLPAYHLLLLLLLMCLQELPILVHTVAQANQDLRQGVLAWSLIHQPGSAAHQPLGLQQGLLAVVWHGEMTLAQQLAVHCQH